MQENITVKNLKKVTRVLNKYGIEFWLDIGTLLAAERDGRLIPWDHDIDLSAWEENMPQIVCACRELLHEGFSIKLRQNCVAIKKDGWPINFSFYQKKGDKAVRVWAKKYSNYQLKKFMRWFSWIMIPTSYSKVPLRLSFNVKSFTNICVTKINSILPHLLRKWLSIIESRLCKKVLFIVPIRYFTELSTKNFYGVEFRVPADTEGYLAYRYGKDWKTPIQNWITIRDDGGVAFVDNYVEKKY